MDGFYEFCPLQGHASYYDIERARDAAWSYRAPLQEMAAIGGLVSFEPDRVDVVLDGRRLQLEPGPQVASDEIDRNLDVGEAGALSAVIDLISSPQPFGA
jgi:Domain of unknown function (DUF427)